MWQLRNLTDMHHNRGSCLPPTLQCAGQLGPTKESDELCHIVLAPDHPNTHRRVTIILQGKGNTTLYVHGFDPKLLSFDCDWAMAHTEICMAVSLVGFRFGAELRLTWMPNTTVCFSIPKYDNHDDEANEDLGASDTNRSDGKILDMRPWWTAWFALIQILSIPAPFLATTAILFLAVCCSASIVGRFSGPIRMSPGSRWLLSGFYALNLLGPQVLAHPAPHGDQKVSPRNLADPVTCST